MSYPKANLGAIVLPVPDDSYSWEEYKDKYGIDLEEIFEVQGSSVRLKPGFSKVLYLRDDEGNQSWFNGVVPATGQIQLTHDDLAFIPVDTTGLGLVYSQSNYNGDFAGCGGIGLSVRKVIEVVD